MAVHHGLPTVTKNLVFEVDAGNKLGGNVTNTKNIVDPTNVGTFVNGISVVNGVFQHDGFNDYINFPNKEVSSGNMSMAAWVNVSSLQNGVILSQADSGGLGIFNFIWLLNNRLTFSVTGTIAGWVQANAVPNLNEWYHVCGTHNESTPIQKLYINGVLQTATASENADYATPDIISIGRSTFGGGSSYLDGGSAHHKIWNRELTAEEVLKDINSNKHKFE